MAATLRSTRNSLTVQSAGKSATPADNEIMANSGAMAAGRYDVRVIVSATLAGVWEILHRNAADDGNIGPITAIRSIATGTAEVEVTFDLAESERVTVIMDGALGSGDGQASLYLEKLG